MSSTREVTAISVGPALSERYALKISPGRIKKPVASGTLKLQIFEAICLVYWYSDWPIRQRQNVGFDEHKKNFRSYSSTLTFSLSGVNKMRSFFKCLCTLWALFSGSNTDTISAVFFGRASWVMVLHKKCFFFLWPLVRSRKTWRKILASVLRTVPTCLVNACCLGN